MAATASVDLLIVGGGVNGCGIARDAAGRGLSVLLVEQDDLASHTSSASTKLIHGGLRYLEHGEFRLVREALIERERLLGIAPHIIRPLRFALPQGQSPRRAWMVRLGLFLYDHLGGRKTLPGTATVRLDRSTLGNGLKPQAGLAFMFSDCRVDDSRLVVLTALDAAERGARILTRTRLIEAERDRDAWVAQIEQADTRQSVRARALINAAGPWVSELLDRVHGAASSGGVRLVKGSHIVVPKLYEGEHAFMLQNPDRRIVFAIPYEDRFTLIGTTDVPWEGPPGPAAISEAEVEYLCDSINLYFERQIDRTQIAWSYAGIRSLHEDHAASASAVTRDYVLECDAPNGGPPLLSVFGGKITTHRRLAEHAMEQLAPHLAIGKAWTADACLPGGDIPGGDYRRFVDAICDQYDAMPPSLVARLAGAYGSRVGHILGASRVVDDLGRHFGGGLYQAEVDYLVAFEWARTAEDVLFRRSKLGLHVPLGADEALQAYLGAAAGTVEGRSESMGARPA